MRGFEVLRSHELLVGMGLGDEVVCSTSTFVASANAVGYLGAVPLFIDSDEKRWYMDQVLLAEFSRSLI